MIMLADSATGTKTGGQALLGGMDIQVHRNYFGAQLASFEAPLEVDDPQVAAAVNNDGNSSFVGVFIRAPAILSCGPAVTPVAWVSRQQRDANVPELPALSAASSAASASDSSVAASSASASTEAAAASTASRVIVAARDANFLVTAFHPELVESPGFHRLFAQQVEARTGKKLIGSAGNGAYVDASSIIPCVASSSSSSASSSSPRGSHDQRQQQQPLDSRSLFGTAQDPTAGNAGSLLIARRVVPGLDPMQSSGSGAR